MLLEGVRKENSSSKAVLVLLRLRREKSERFVLDNMSLWLSTWMLLLGFPCRGEFSINEFKGPSFINEPPSFVDFSNATGKWIDCTARGSPPPVVKWALADGTAIVNIPGLRQILSNGTLHFFPFRAEDYRPDVHAVTYKCFASNPSGVIVSRDVKIRAVVLQIYEVQVYDEYIIRGNTAVMKCHIPSFVKDYVTVIAWVQEKYGMNMLIENDGRYLIMPTGELYILDVTSTDGLYSYRCRTNHRLTGETRTSGSSPSGRLYVSEPRGSVTPRITDSKPFITARQGDFVMLPCAAQGYPVPNYSWYKKDGEGDYIPINFNEKYRQISGVLAIANVQSSDGGTYSCEASNSMGSVRMEMILEITASLSALVYPPRQTVDLGESATLNCVVSGYPAKDMTWVKDGKPLTHDSINHLTKEVLRISSVQKHDRGMYQCFVSNDMDVSQGTAELRLGDTPPEFQKTFLNRTVHPDSSLFLQCIVTGNPTPDIVWTLDDMKLAESSRYTKTEYVDLRGDIVSHVNISNVQVEDSGEYRCRATSRAGRIEHSARINVFGDPYIRLPPQISVVANKNLTVRCHVAGFPIESIKWERDGRILPTNHRQRVISDGTLIIENVQRYHDGGRYTCIARNTNGRTDRRDLEVIVLAPPKIMPFSFQDTHLKEGARARIQCVVSEGDLPISFTWLKDGKPISSNSEISLRDLDEYSSMLTVLSVSSRHNGYYTCLASNHAASVNYSAQLSVNVPPEIMPFPDVQLKEGMRAQITCAISQGDPPIRIVWVKDGQPIPPSLYVAERNFDQYSSSLTIESIKSVHSGNYTCLASNSAAESRYTMQLFVNVPPRWLVAPRDTHVLLGESTTINCRADGFPKPVITWMKALGNAPSDYYEVSPANANIRLLKNGSLQLITARQSDRGYYLCKANNGIGAGLSQVIQLYVHVPAHFQIKYRNSTAKIGENAHLLCEAMGDKQLTITWYRESLQLYPEMNPKYQVKEDNWDKGITSRLIIIRTEKDDAGTYFCIVRNDYGEDKSALYLLVQDFPSAPTNVKVIDRSSKSIQLTWFQPHDGNTQIIRYTIQFKPATASWNMEARNATVIAIDHVYTITGLHPATHYHFRIFATNSVGTGPPSDIIDVVTAMEAPGGPPEDVQVDAIDPKTLNVTWKPPKRYQWHGEISGYNIGYKMYDSTETYSYKTVKAPPSSDSTETLQISLHNLKKFTKYGVIVQAFNRLGAGPKSEEVVARTTEDAPSKPPENVRCSALTSQSLLVSWEPPPQSGINGLLQGYKVLYSPSEKWYDGADMETKITSAWKTIIHGLERYKNYSIQALAFTRVGDGVKSRPVFCQTQEDVPDAPSDIKALTMSSDSILVVWKAPQKINGVIIKYTLYSRNADSVQDDMTKHIISSDYTLHEIRNLREGRRYEFWVTASTSIGEGQSTKVVSQTPGQHVPARIAGFDDYLISRWRDNIALSCRAVGIPNPEREWRFADQILRRSERIFWEPEGALQIMDIQSSDAGNYSCRVYNLHGSDKISYHLSIQAPPGSPSLHVGPTTNTSISIQWKAGSDGGGPIEEYNVHYKRDFGEWENQSLSPKLESTTLENLWCGTRYQLYITARNRIGVGEASSIKTVRTKGSAPESPPREKLLRENSTFILLNLLSWGDGGCRILYFVIEYKPRIENVWMLVSNNVNTQREQYAILDLLPNVWYNLRVTAHNTAGSTVANYDFVTKPYPGGSLNTDPEAPNGEEEKDSNDIIDVKILFPILAFLVVLITAIVAVYCFRTQRDGPNRQEDGTSRETGKQYEARYFPSATKMQSSILPSDFDKGSFACLLVNVDAPHNPCAPNSPRKGGVRDELQPYATYKLPTNCKTDNFTAEDWKKYEVYAPGHGHPKTSHTLGTKDASETGSGSGNIYPMLKKEECAGPDSSLSDDQEYASPVRSSDTSDSNSGSCQAQEAPVGGDPTQGQRPRPIDKIRKPGRRAKVPDLIYRQQQECCSRLLTPPGEACETLCRVQPIKIPRPQLEKPSAPLAESTIDTTFSFLDNMGSSQESSDTKKDENSDKQSSRESSST